MAALGVNAGTSTSEVSRIWPQRDQQLVAVRTRSLADTLYPYLFLGSTYVTARAEGRAPTHVQLVRAYQERKTIDGSRA